MPKVVSREERWKKRKEVEVLLLSTYFVPRVISFNLTNNPTKSYYSHYIDEKTQRA